MLLKCIHLRAQGLLTTLAVQLTHHMTQEGLGRAWIKVTLLATSVLVSSPSWAQPFDKANQAQVRAAVPAADAAYLVQTGARLILPKARTARLRDVDQNEKVFVQFQRTLRSDERARLRAAGIVFHESFEPFTYLVSVPESAAAALEQQPLFRGLEPIAPSDKLTVGLFLDQVPAHAQRPGGAVAVFIRFYKNVSLTEALAALDEAGVTVPDRSRLLFGNRLQATAARGQLLAASRSPLVRAISEIPPPPVSGNADAATFSLVPPLHVAPYNLSGAATLIGVCTRSRSSRRA